MSADDAPGHVRHLPSDQDASGRSFGREEVALLEHVIRSGVLISTKGRQVRALEEAFARTIGVGHALACSSGSAAMHAAIAAIDPEPGEEIVTTAVTDMGAIAPILCQGAIPVFADVDPATCNVTAETIAARLGPRTRAIVVTHLFGAPCEMGPILALAHARGIPVIEDCAQAFLATDAGRIVGSMGAIGVFSLQQGKHLTCGEGGLAVTQDPALARRMRLFINKGWDYDPVAPDHRVLAPNYRMTELQGAVAVAQLEKLAPMVESRRQRARQLTRRLAGVAGLSLPVERADAQSAFWRYALGVEKAVHPGGPRALAGRLAAHGIAASAHYVGKPAFECEVFVRQKTFGNSRWPFTLAHPDAVDYRRERFPGTYAALGRLVVLPWSERLGAADVDYIGTTIESALRG